jgi:agmatine deiminase
VRQKDEQAKAVFRKVFPTREIYSVNPIGLNYDGGGLHCITLP